MALLVIFLATSLAYAHGKSTPMIGDVSVGNGGVTSPQNINFMSYRLDPLDDTFSAHKPLKLEGFKGNEGGNFNLETGYFTAPLNGLYVFNFTTYDTMERRVRLMKNEYEVRILTKDGKGKAKKLTKGDVLLQLDEGDRVWLRLGHKRRETDKTKVKSTEVKVNSTLTTFSGRLLTTDVHINMASVHRRHKRSSGQSSQKSLERQIREANYLPVSLVEKNSSMPFNPDSVNNDVTSGSERQRIAFSVTCTKSMIGGHMADTTESLNGDMSPEAAPNGRIGFDKTLVNVGGGFDIAAAEFVAPSGGIYFFTYNVGKFPRKKLSVMLMKNFNEVQSIIYNDSKTRAREIQGQSLMLQLKKGDTMWLRSYNDNEYAVYSNLGNYITFSGYLVF